MRFIKRSKGFFSVHPGPLSALNGYAHPLAKHLDDARRFLQDNPTEFLIWRVKMVPGWGSAQDFSNALHHYEMASNTAAYGNIPLTTFKVPPTTDDDDVADYFLSQKQSDVAGKLIILSHNNKFFPNPTVDTSCPKTTTKICPFFKSVTSVLSGKASMTSSTNTKPGVSGVMELQNSNNKEPKKGWGVGDVEAKKLNGVWYNTYTGDIYGQFVGKSGGGTIEGNDLIYEQLTDTGGFPSLAIPASAKTFPKVFWGDFNGLYAYAETTYAKKSGPYKYMAEYYNMWRRACKTTPANANVNAELCGGDLPRTELQLPTLA